MAFPNRPKRKVWRTTLEILEARRALTTVSGSVFEDLNNDGTFDSSQGETGIDNVMLFVDANLNGELDESGFGMDPDEFSEGAVLNNSRQTVFPSAAGIDNEPTGRVRALRTTITSTGDLVFGQDDSTTWTSSGRLRFDFTLPVDSVSLDAIGADGNAFTNVQIDAYDDDGNLLAVDTANRLANDEPARLVIERPTRDIRYVVAHVVGVGSATFDNLGADNQNSERSTVTSEVGFYRFSDLPDGLLTIAQVESKGYETTNPESGIQQVNVAEAVNNLDFANRTASINGIAFEDSGILGVYEPTIDRALVGSPVFLDANRNGEADTDSVTVNPNIFLDDQVLEFVSEDVRITAVDADNQPTNEFVMATTDEVTNPDGKLFTHNGDAAWTNERRMRLDFDAPASRVEVNFISGATNGVEQGVLVAYNSNGDEIASTTTTMLSLRESEVMVIERDGFDISYVVAYTAANTGDQGRLDNLMATIVAEPIAITDAEGEYTFKPLAKGSYRVAALPVSGKELSFPNDEVYDVDVAVGETESLIDFGFTIENDSPIARDDTANTIEDAPIAIGVLLNDFDEDGSLNPGSIRIKQGPANGTIEVTPEGLIEYTPITNFFGSDTLIYTVRDNLGAESNSAVVTINISSVNDAPIAVNDEVSTMGQAPTVIGILNNDVDLDGNLVPSSIKIVRQPTAGTLSIDDSSGNVTYTPDSNADDSFQYTVLDNDDQSSNVATVTITALQNGTPPVAIDDSASTSEGTPVRINVMGNDSDPDGFIVASSIVITSPPASGEVVIEGDRVAYLPALGFFGDVSFDYLIRDDNGLASNDATVNISIAERDFPYMNPLNNLDVDNNGFVIPRDALIIINEINDRQVSDGATGQITNVPVSPSPPVAWMDTDGDGFIIARDALAVINFLNSQQFNSEPAAEPTADSAADSGINAAAAAHAFASDFDAFDDDEEEDA